MKGKGVKRYRLDWEKSYVKWGKWLMSPKAEHYFEQPKILLRQITSDYFFAVLDKNKFYADQSLYICTHFPDQEGIDLEFYLGLLNSRLYGFYFRKFYSEEDDLFPKIKVSELKSLPVGIPDELSVIRIIDLVKSITGSYKIYDAVNSNFLNFLSQTLKISKSSRKLENWHELEFGEFIKELNKAINKENRQRRKDGVEELPKLTKKDEFEWMEIFEENKKKAQDLQSQITATEKEIDQMVYELYGLTEEEIEIVEKS
ncbi:MAG: TaqI-like C-terminal specificity domain-containing protein [Nonlabens sp.]